MITNEREYRVTRAQVRELELALESESHRSTPQGVDPFLAAAAREALRGELDELKAQLEEYDQLKSGQKKSWLVDSIGKLPEVIIQARVAAGMTQRVFAETLHVKEQQVQRYEATKYHGVSLERIEQAADAAGLRCQVFAWSEPLSNSADEKVQQLFAEVSTGAAFGAAAIGALSNATIGLLSQANAAWWRTGLNLPYSTAGISFQTQGTLSIGGEQQRRSAAPERLIERTGMQANRLESVNA
jgi:transcriptional regulator with XRE-family HTH domain